MATPNTRSIQPLLQPPTHHFSSLDCSALTFRGPNRAQLQDPVGFSHVFDVLSTWYKLGTKWVRNVKESLSPTGGSEPPDAAPPGTLKCKPTASSAATSRLPANVQRSPPFKSTLGREVTSARSEKVIDNSWRPNTNDRAERRGVPDNSPPFQTLGDAARLCNLF